MRSARRNWLVWMCAAAALGLPAAPAMAQQSQDWLWCVNKNNAYSVDQALKACTAVIKSGKESRRNLAIAYNNRAVAYYRKNDYEHTIADYSEAIRLDRTYADAFQGRASAWSDKGDHDKAIADYNESIRLNTSNPIAFNNRCDELLILRQVQAALADCNESLRQRPNHANTLMHRGNAYLAAAQYDKAITDYEAALRHNAKDAWSLYGRGYAKKKLGNDAAGDADIAAAQAIVSNIADGFKNRGIQ